MTHGGRQQAHLLVGRGELDLTRWILGKEAQHIEQHPLLQRRGVRDRNGGQHANGAQHAGHQRSGALGGRAAKERNVAQERDDVLLEYAYRLCPQSLERVGRRIHLLLLVVARLHILRHCVGGIRCRDCRCGGAVDALAGLDEA